MKRGISPTSSQRIRNNFLRELGVCVKPQHVLSVSDRSARDIRDSHRLNEPLQYDHQEERARQEQHRSFRSQSPSSVASEIPREQKQVNFCESVTVVLIPMIDDYSSRIQAKLFYDSEEMSQNLERNLVEFNAERCDWFQVCLEEAMYVCEHTGELIHPVHKLKKPWAVGPP